MNLIQKIGAFGLIAATALSVSAFSPAIGAQADEEKTVEMYLIGGQSNAAGMSKHLYAVNEKFENIGYMGEVESNSLDQKPVRPEQVRFSDVIERGLGHSKESIGPEYGMGKALNGYYDGENRAFIFKYAVGGSPVFGTNRSDWRPKSLWESGHEPDLTREPTGTNGVGWLYQMFLYNFEYCYESLKADGYTPVVKGMAWMQGESDLGRHDQYGPALEALIGDFRSDLSQITGDDLSGMPFVVGEIATTYQMYENPAVPPFIEAQRAVAAKMSGVETVSTNDLIIVNRYGGVSGSDNSHFNVNDEVTLGLRFGRKLAALNGKKTVEVEEKGGFVTYDFTDPESLVLTLTPSDNNSLTEFTVNGQDKLSEVQNGTYTVISPDKNTQVKAVFSAKTRYQVSYAKVENAEFISSPAFVYDGELLQVRLKAKAGYEVLSVRYGDREMSYNEADDCYETVANGANTVTVQMQKITADPPSQNGLAGWAIALIAVGCALVAGGIGIAVYFVCRNKKNQSA